MIQYPKTYLGDSVYAEVNDVGQIVLTTNNGLGDTNTIYLEQEVYVALIEYHTRWWSNLIAQGQLTDLDRLEKENDELRAQIAKLSEGET
jgi:hypothetical protein